MSKRYRNICFTLNNYTQDEYEYLSEFKTKYTIIGKEIGEKGTPHLQGYMEFENAISHNKIKKLSPRLHFEPRRGTPKQASDYCKKDNNYFESGTLSKQGERTDLSIVAEKIIEKEDIRKIALEHPTTFIKYHKGLTALHNIIKPHRDKRPTCYWFYGSSGVGKTYRAKQLGKSYFIKDNTKWWADYNQEEVIIIDDFRKDDVPLQVLLKWLDENKLSVEVKGGYIPLNSPIIAITCDVGPHQYWQGNDLLQLKRRLTGGIHYMEKKF